MRKQLYLLFFLCYGIACSQNLEEEIYSATETFNNNANSTTFHQLELQETTFKNQIKTNEEQLAFVFLLCNKAYYLREVDQNNAIITYEDAWERFTKHKLSILSNYDMIENCLKPLGNLHIKTRDYTNAESTIKQYIYLAEHAHNKIHEIAGFINLAILYHSKGDHSSVIQISDKALKNKALNPDQKQNLLRIRNRSLIVLGKINAMSSSNSEYNTNYINYELELSRGNYKKALDFFNKAKSNPQKEQSIREVTKSLLQEALLHYLLEQPNKAIKNLHEATKTLLPNFNGDGLPKKEILYAENIFIDIFELLAELQVQPEKKLECYDLSFYVSDLLSAQIRTQETKLLNLTNNRKRSEKCIAICFSAYSNSQNKKFLEAAFYYSEQHKATVLKDRSHIKLLFEQFPNDTLLQKQQQLLQTQERLTIQLTNQPIQDIQKESISNTLYKQLSSVNLTLKEISKTISKSYPKAQHSSFNIAELQQKLAIDNAVMVEYFYGNKEIFQFIISSDKLSFYKIILDKSNLNNINTFIHQFDNASIINNNITQFTENAFNTYKVLNLSKTSSHKNLVIIPDGLLNFIPFEALLTHKTSLTNYSKMPFMVKSNIIAYNSSVQFYLHQTETTKSTSLLGVFPVFKNSNQALNYSIKEAEVIASKMNSTLLMQDQATTSNFIEQASKFNILHLSTHATSGTFTTPASIEFYDKTMSLNELYSLSLNNQLVVLSACETGIGRLQKGEGALSIARGFQYAGAKHLLFSLWRINDLSTSQIMHSFYKNYSSKSSGVVSNNSSKIYYLNNEAISNIKKSPYYWSAFVYYGDFSKQSVSNYSAFTLLGLLIITLIVLFLVYKIICNGKISKT